MNVRLLSSCLGMAVAFLMVGPQTVDAQLFQRLGNQRSARPLTQPLNQRQAAPQYGYRYGQPTYRPQTPAQPRGLFRNSFRNNVPNSGLGRQPNASRQRQPNTLRSLFSNQRQPSATPTPSSKQPDKQSASRGDKKATGPQVPNTNLTRNEYAQIVYGGANKKNAAVPQPQRLKTPTDGRIHVHMPASAKAGLIYTINGKPSKLQPGRSFSLDGNKSWVIGFKPSSSAAEKKYTLSKVTNYQFEQIRSGWELIEVDYNAKSVEEAFAKTKKTSLAKKSSPAKGQNSVTQTVAKPKEDTGTEEEVSILDAIVNEAAEEQTETSNDGGN